MNFFYNYINKMSSKESKILYLINEISNMYSQIKLIDIFFNEHNIENNNFHTLCKIYLLYYPIKSNSSLFLYYYILLNDLILLYKTYLNISLSFIKIINVFKYEKQILNKIIIDEKINYTNINKNILNIYNIIYPKLNLQEKKIFKREFNHLYEINKCYNKYLINYINIVNKFISCINQYITLN